MASSNGRWNAVVKHLAAPPRPSSSSPSAWLGALALATAGCASSGRECGTGLDRPEFGSATGELIDGLGEAPEAFAAEWDVRSARVANSIHQLFIGRGREWDVTAAELDGFSPWLADECVEDRPPQLWSFLGRQGGRAIDDAACFPARAWHSIKLAIE